MEMNTHPLKIYKASAGSGKTYNLTLKFLEILFSNPHSYKSILAVTFTNKAAGEMKHRILEKLYQLSRNDPESDDYRRHLVDGKFATDFKDVKNKAIKILKLILNDYSGFYVQTIDKFFQWVIRGFTKEIGLQNSYNLELNSNAILTEAIDLLMLGMDEDRDLRDWLIQFAKEKLSEGKSWNIQADVFSLGNEVFREQYQELQENISGIEERKQNFLSLRTRLKKDIIKFENDLKAKARNALKIIEQKGLKAEDFSYGKGGAPGIFYQVLEKPLTKVGEVKRSRAAMNDSSKWHKKNDVNQARIEAAFHSGLNGLLIEILDFWDGYKKDYFTAISINKNIYSFGILSEISDRIIEISHEKNIFLLSDSTIFLKKIVAENEAPFIFEKAGNYFQHFMLDEFQDTSRYQYFNFRPLIENSLSAGNTNIIVGDVKQSIYRWRNSDWKILANELDKDFGSEWIENISLDKNYRSSGNLIRFFNSVFSNACNYINTLIDSQLRENDDEQFREEWTRLVEKVYGKAGQMIPGSENQKGYIRHSFFEDLNKNEIKENLGHILPELICELQDRNYSAGDITILVKTGKEGTDVANILLEAQKNSNKKYNFQFISNDSLYISKNSANRFLIAVLKYLNYSMDKLNTRLLKYEYLRFLKESEFDMHEVFSLFESDDSEQKQDHFFLVLKEQFYSLKTLPLYELTEELIRIFELNSNPSNLPYLQALQDQILDFSRREAGDINTFIKNWEENKGNWTLNISEGQDAIRIMTIHKSKGLEFKVVILPFCDWTLGADTSGMKAGILWPSSSSTKYEEFPNLPILNSSSLKETHFHKEYFEEYFRSYVDNLNLLYVAFTRAEIELFAFSGIKTKKTETKTIADLLHHVYSIPGKNDSRYPFLNLPEQLNESKIRFEYGEKQILEKEKESSAGEQTFYLGKYPVTRKTEVLSLNHKNIYLSDLMEEPTMSTGYGTQMHEIFAGIKYLEDVDNSLRKVWLKGLLRSSDRDRFSVEIRKKLTKKPFSDWFSKDYVVKNESEIMDVGDKSFRPDRIMIKEKDCIIVDYKFGKNKSAKYHTQVKEYAKLLYQLGFGSVKTYLWYYNLDELEEVQQ